ncbi:MAG: hypothetical protein JWM05_2797 [Acidimicrobiales bacterium]|nr:hypothetical protein [Acidimicrobiales bacterium]
MVVLLSALLVVAAAVLLILQFLQGGSFELVYTAMAMAAASMVLLQLARWMGSRPEGARRTAPEPLAELVAAGGPAARARVERDAGPATDAGAPDELLWAPAPPTPIEVSAGTPVYEEDLADDADEADEADDDVADEADPSDSSDRSGATPEVVRPATLPEPVVDLRVPTVAEPEREPEIDLSEAEPEPVAVAAAAPAGTATVRTFLGRRTSPLTIDLGNRDPDRSRTA